MLVDILTLASLANNSPLDLETDIAFLVCLSGNISVHLFFLVKDTVDSTRAKCRRSKRKGGCCCLKKVRANVYEVKETKGKKGHEQSNNLCNSSATPNGKVQDKLIVVKKLSVICEENESIDDSEKSPIKIKKDFDNVMCEDNESAADLEK